MLSCRKTGQRASASLDGDLWWPGRIALWLHLLMCRHCRRLMRQLRQLTAALSVRSGVWTPPVDPAWVEQVLQKLAANGSVHGPPADNLPSGT